MLFNSREFLFGFLPLALTAFYLLRKYAGMHYALVGLLVSSLVFYSWWNPAYLLLLLVSIGVNYGLSVAIQAARDRPGSIRGYFAAGILFNLGLLGYFKYSGFVVQTVNSFAGSGFSVPDIVLPLAISFFTFQQIAYLADVRRDAVNVVNPTIYCLFVSFFPQLIAGPIVHLKDIAPQLKKLRQRNRAYLDISVGLTILIIGLFKKVVLADGFAEISDAIFARASTGQTLDAVQSCRGIFAYSLQIYFDFSAYSDMATGLARMFGIRLPLNFFSPYRASSIAEFWQRWHITLSRFLRDYLYVPLGGNRKGEWRRYTNVLLTMLIGGLWHGASWTFVLWGGIHGVLIVINHLWRKIVPRRNRGEFSRTAARLITFLCVSFAWVFFRAASFDGAVAVFAGFAHLPSNLLAADSTLAQAMHGFGIQFDGRPLAFANLLSLLWLAAWLAVLWFWPNTWELTRRYRPNLVDHLDSRSFLTTDRARIVQLRWRPTIYWAIVIAVLAAISLLHLSDVSEFIYFQF